MWKLKSIRKTFLKEGEEDWNRTSGTMNYLSRFVHSCMSDCNFPYWKCHVKWKVRCNTLPAYTYFSEEIYSWNPPQQWQYILKSTVDTKYDLSANGVWVPVYKSALDIVSILKTSMIMREIFLICSMNFASISRW